MSDTRTLDDIEEDLRAANARVYALQAERYAAKCDIAGIHPGDIVRAIPSEHFHEKNPYAGLLKVTRVESSYASHNSAAIYAYKRKNNGDWYASPQYIGSRWRHLTAAERMELHAEHIA